MPVLLGKPQTKYIRFYLNLDKITQISLKEFKTLNWLLVGSRFNKCVNVMVYKGINSMFLSYLYEVFEIAPDTGINLRNTFQRFKTLSCKTTAGQNLLSSFIVFKVPQSFQKICKHEHF